MRKLSRLVLSAAMALPWLSSVYAQSEPQAGDPKQQTGSNPSASPESADDPEAMLPHLKDTRFWLSGQANFIFQTHPPFHASYSGKNSLDPNYEKATSRVLTLYYRSPPQ
jgi:high affinity Mn2+ porin